MSINDNTWQKSIARILGESSFLLTWQRAIAILAGQIEDFVHGHFPGMTSGVADTISGDPTTSTFPSSTNCDGMAEVKSIQGNTVRWNQYGINTQPSAATDLTITVNDDNSVHITGTTEASRVIYFYDPGTITSHKMPIVNGHKYIAKGCPAGGSASTYRIRTFLPGSPASVDDYGSGHLFIAGGTGEAYSIVSVVSGATVDADFGSQLFDLTHIFGAGNEPSTVAEFEAQFPEAFYPYDSGSLLSVNMSGIQTKDADDNSVDSVEIPVSTYFPTGMKSAGSAHDALYDDHAVNEVETVIIDGTNVKVYSVSTISGTDHALIDMGADSLPSIYNKALTTCDRLPGISGDSEYSGNTGIAIANTRFLRFTCSDIQGMNASQVDTWLTSNPLTVNYKTATPTTQTIDPPLSMRYHVVEGGTESIIPSGTGNPQSAQPIVTARYPQSFDMVRDASLGVIAPVENSKASTNYSIDSYLINNGRLCKVTSAIASGEDVVQGTNCTATTVMAEVVSLSS